MRFLLRPLLPILALTLLAGLHAKDLENPNLAGDSKAPTGDAGDFRHPTNGVVFPAIAAGMKREPVKRFDVKGENVSTGYFGKVGDRVVLICSVFSYPRPSQLADLRAAFEDASAAVTQNNAAARRVSARPIAEGGFDAEFQYTQEKNGVSVPMKSRLILFGRGPWLLKYRFTYAASESVAAEDLMQRLMRSIGRSAARN